MKTIEIIKHTGEHKTVDGAEQEILETVRQYQCEDGQENNLLYRAKLTAELYSRDTGYKHEAKIIE